MTAHATVYLSGPIAGCTDEQCQDWRQAAIADLTNPVKNTLYDRKTFDIINPMDRDYRGKCDQVYHEVVELDKRDIRDSDVMLINWKFPSVGTSMEILYAWEHNVVNVLVLPSDKDKGDISPWLLYHCTKVTNSLDEAIEWIREKG